jgi:hypothetical protein
MPQDSRFQFPDSRFLVSESPPRALLVTSLLVCFQITGPSFEPVQPEVLGRGGTLVNAWADVDLDRDPDLFVGFNGEPNRLYRNDAGTLVDVAADLGVADARATRAAAWGDFDGDGDSDLLVGFAPGDGSVLKLYRNDRGHFADVTSAVGLARDGGAVRQPVWVDFDGDGDLDLFVAFRDGPNAMFRNIGGRFEDAAAAAGLADPRRSVGAVWFDADGDGDLDVYVANMDGDANGLFLNQSSRPMRSADGAPPRFEDAAGRAGLEWGGRLPRDPAHGTVRPCAADVDNDGRLDLFMANSGPNGLFLNRGRGNWEDVSEAWGIDIDGRYDTCAFADIDNDGYLDLYVNGTFTGGQQYPDYLFRGTGRLLDDVTPGSLRTLQADHGVAWADVDGDGDLDLSLTGSRPEGMHLVMRNGLAADAAARSLFVRVETPGGQSCPGAEVRLAEPGGSGRVQARLVDAGSGYNAQSDLPVHFGLPSIGRVNLEVVCPSLAGGAGRRALTIDPVEYRGRVLTVDVGSGGGADDTMSVR